MKQLPLFQHTANAEMAGRILKSSILPADTRDESWEHNRITTANDSHFTQATFSVAETRYAVGWQDEVGYDELVEFVAPNFQAEGERFEHALYSNAEAFLSDGAYDDLRAINADFKTIETSETKATRKIANRGLRIELDWDKIKNKPNWQRLAVDTLMGRLKRNQYRRSVALAIAAATADTAVFSVATDPDNLINSQILLAKDSSGLKPNRMLYGDTAWSLRFGAYGGSDKAAATAGRSMNLQQVSSMLGVLGMEDGARYQSGTSKASVLGSKVLLFTGIGGKSETDPSNFKLAWIPCETGGRYAVYIRQVSVKKWEVIVEHYERLFAATTLGARIITVSAS